MKVKILEKQIESIQNGNLSAIIQLIIDAIRDFPLFEIDDTELYFDEVKKLIGSDTINQNTIEHYLKSHQQENTENEVWINCSLNNLLEALSLMNLYKISFKEFQNKIINLT